MAANMETEEFATRCSFFLKRKNRHCKMIPGKGKRYCGEHSYLSDGNKDSSAQKRIPCPLDTKHTVFEDQLEKHLKKCNVTKKREVAYYVANINSGIKQTGLSCEKLPLRKIPNGDIQNCIDKINSYFEENPVDVKTLFLSEACLENEIKNMSHNPALTKHLQQQSSLIGNLRNAELLTSDVIYVEFGAGRGMLSHWIQKSMQDETNVDFLLVDRASARYKADSYHRRADQGPSFHRIQIDIEHLSLDKVQLVSKSQQEITGVSKHLCGAATDLALRCLFNSSDSNEFTGTDESYAEEEARSTKRRKLDHSRVRGLLFALCCHHCCSWGSYVGRDFLENLGFTSYDFHILCCLSSWATCGSRKLEKDKADEEVPKQNLLPNEKTSEDGGECKNEPEGNNDLLKTKCEDEHHTDVDEGSCIKALGFSKSESEEIGRRSKRLIDAGRVWYLKQFEMDASLLYYVDRSVSLENVALIAWNSGRKVKKKDRREVTLLRTKNGSFPSKVLTRILLAVEKTSDQLRAVLWSYRDIIPQFCSLLK